MSAPPVIETRSRSSKCPECGSASYSPAPQEMGEGISVVRDRICNECETRYTPPIPGWAPIMMIGLGALLALGGLALGIGLLGGAVPWKAGVSTASVLALGIGLSVLGFGVQYQRNLPETVDVAVCSSCGRQLGSLRIKQCKCGAHWQ